VIRFRSVNRWYRERFGQRVQRLPLYGGATCPNRDGTKGTGGCLYCDSRGSAADHLDFTATLTRQFESGVREIENRYNGSSILLYFQPFSTTYGDRDNLETFLRKVLKDERVRGVSLATRPDCLSNTWLDFLEELGRQTYVELELGLESASDATLSFLNRGHSVSDFTRAADLVRQRGIPVIAHAILGLPGEETGAAGKLGALLAGLPLHGVKYHAFHLMASSPLARMLGFKRGDKLMGGESLCAEGIPAFKILTPESYAACLIEALLPLPRDTVIYRFTGERFSDDMVGPLWLQRKLQTRTELKRRLETAGISIE